MIDLWTETTLGEVIELYDHKRIPLNTRQRSERQGEFPYYGAAGIIDSVDDYIFDGRYLLIAEDGSVITQDGKPVLNLVNGKFWVSNHAHVVRGKSPISTDFLYYALSNVAIIGYLTGTAQPKLSQTNLKTIKLTLPPIPIQQKITSILSTYDNLIENNTRRIKILEDMAQTLYREWFVHHQFPGPENVPKVESELGPIPRGWEVVQFSDILDLVRNGITPSKFPEEIFAHFSIPAFDNEHMPALEDGDSIRSAKYLVTGGSVLLSKLNPRIPRVWLPFLNTEHKAIASTEFFILKPKPPVNCMFLYNLFRSPEFTENFIVRALGTSTSHQRVKPDDFLNMPVSIPTESLLNDFRQKVSPLVNICNTLRLKNINLRQTRDLFLPKLISGEIDVSELDIDRDSTI
ncbi:hypothetical protein C6501_00530 [Candidatus Poribacteria bacterium]|nr:MAG: hypothetical protein C6501_00530 [Candidatus Poribacteria bacterium]